MEEIGLRLLFQLLVAAHEEEHLGLEGVAAGVLVEVLEEGILLGLLEDELGVETLGQELREARLPDTDDPLDRDVARRHSPYRVSTRTGRLCGPEGWGADA